MGSAIRHCRALVQLFFIKRDAKIVLKKKIDKILPETGEDCEILDAHTIPQDSSAATCRLETLCLKRSRILLGHSQYREL